MRNILFLSLALAVAGCGIGQRLGLTKVTSEAGQPYRAVLSDGDDPRDFTVAVEAPGASVEEVRESVRYPATRYCIETFGASDADWTLDPATGDWLARADGEDLVFSGRCTAR